MNQTGQQLLTIQVLIVEDNPGDVGLAREGIESDQSVSVSVQVAATLAKAFAAIEAAPPDVILLDLGLPDSFGLSTLEHIREAGPEIPVVVVTGQYDPAIGVKCIELGAQSYLVKGRPESAISSAIRNAVECAAAEKTARQAHENLKRVLDNSLDAILVLEADGVVKFANQAATRMFGARAAEGQNPGLMLETVETQELEVPHSDGSVAIVDVRMGETNWFGEPAEIVTFRDVTERKQGEEKIRELNANLERRVRERTVELELANQELDSFSSSVSHDLHAPLRYIQVYVDILNEEAAGQLSPVARKQLQVISDSSVKMSRLIENVLAFSRMGRAEMRDGSVRLDELVQESIRDLEMIAPNRNIDWNVAPLPTVTGDQAMLRQVFINLIGNAVKYSRQRDPAEIAIGCNAGAEGCPVFFVRDNGAGFKKKNIHKLFGMFQRLHTDREFEGTGVGLAIVQRIVTRHGGRVWAEGDVDQGATFYFTLNSERTTE